MNPSRIFPIAAVVLMAGTSPAWAQPDDAPPLTHASVTVRGDYSHSAFIHNAPSSTVPATIVQFTATPRPQYGRGHRYRHHDGHGRRYRSRGVHVHGNQCCWTSGAYRLQSRQEWIPGCWVKRYVSARYETRLVNGRYYRSLVRGAYYRDEFVAGHYETTRVSVWVPGYWRCRG